MAILHTRDRKRIAPERDIESEHPGIADNVTGARQVSAGSGASITRRVMGTHLA